MKRKMARLRLETGIPKQSLRLTAVTTWNLIRGGGLAKEGGFVLIILPETLFLVILPEL